MTAVYILNPIKFCKRCQADTERYADGKCRPCRIARGAAWYAENSEKLSAENAARYAANLEKARATKAAWRAKNPNKVNAATAAYRAANPDKVKAALASWVAKNPDKVNAYNAAWAKANPEARRIHNQNRRARKRANGGTLSRGLSAKLFKLQKGKCACCGKPLGDNYHLDHIIPVSLGGTNTDDNTQLLRQRCNQQKGAKHPMEFMQSRGFLL